MSPISDEISISGTLAAQDFASAIDPSLLLWSEIVPGGAHWSFLVRRGTTMRIVDLEGGANVAALLYNADELLERLNVPDTLKAQHTAHLTRGNVLYSDMGRVLASISADTVGWHDPLCGVADADLIRSKYGEHRYQEYRNDMYRNGKDGLLIEIGKWGLGVRDLVPNINFFSKVSADAAGCLQFAGAHSKPGDYIELRFEMNTLLALSTAPHPLDTSATYQPKRVGLAAWFSGPAPQDDPCRLHCPENRRGFENTERLFAEQSITKELR